jgi:nucleoid-associated protein YgaU
VASHEEEVKVGIFDKLLGRDKEPEKRPDFSGVRTGSGSTLGEKAEPVRSPEAPAGGTAGTAAGATVYEVKSGDSLSKIAQRYYGNANEWPKIYEANRDKIKDPDLIYPGQKLTIPKD